MSQTPWPATAPDWRGWSSGETTNAVICDWLIDKILISGWSPDVILICDWSRDRILICDWFRWDNETLRFSDKNQKAIDLLRTKCLKLKSMVLCDGKVRAQQKYFLCPYKIFSAVRDHEGELRARGPAVGDQDHGEQPRDAPLPPHQPRRAHVRVEEAVKQYHVFIPFYFFLHQNIIHYPFPTVNKYVSI